LVLNKYINDVIGEKGIRDSILYWYSYYYMYSEILSLWINNIGDITGIFNIINTNNGML
jgi:hypothetical protein